MERDQCRQGQGKKFAGQSGLWHIVVVPLGRGQCGAMLVTAIRDATAAVCRPGASPRTGALSYEKLVL